MTKESLTPTESFLPNETSLVAVSNAAGGPNDGALLPVIIAQSDPHTARRFLEFFTVTIRNQNTRRAYARAAGKFLDYCEKRGIMDLKQIEPMLVAAFIEGETKAQQAQTVKQELAAIRMLFDYLVVTQVLPFNPASSVRGPRYSIKKGKTPVLSGSETKRLLESIPIYKDKKGAKTEENEDTNENANEGTRELDLMGLRDRALIALMVYSFARVGAVVKMNVGDYYRNGRRMWLRLHEKGGKFHEVPVHHSAEEYLHAYLEAAGIEDQKKTPLFRSVRGRTKGFTGNAMSATDALRMIKRRALVAGQLPEGICNHTFRATGITNYLQNGGTIENAQVIAAHESPRTTKLYDRRSDEISLDEIERIIL